jgi:hypothetical protein
MAGRRIHSELKEFIELQAAKRRTPPEIHRELERRSGEIQKRLHTTVPDLRTIQRHMADMPKRDTNAWTLEQADSLAPEDLSAVLDALRALITYYVHRTGLIQTEVTWIVRLRKAVPEFDGAALLNLAWLYSTRQSGATADLDAFVALAPWRSPWMAVAYFSLCDLGIITEAPWTLLEGHAKDEDGGYRFRVHNRLTRLRAWYEDEHAVHRHDHSSPGGGRPPQTPQTFDDWAQTHPDEPKESLVLGELKDEFATRYRLDDLDTSGGGK